MSLFVPKRVMEAEDVRFGVCVWRFEDGSYLQDDDGNFFSSQGKPFDKSIELRMIEIVKKEFGNINGVPFWLPGFRKISDSEWDDQMETLIGGGTPDPVDVVRQLQNAV